MPVRKHQSKDSYKNGALVPRKEEAFPTRKPLVITTTNQIDKPRINALATAGKKKRPK
jgi:electron transfer flavoprotein alpha/beta subunit